MVYFGIIFACFWDLDGLGAPRPFFEPFLQRIPQPFGTIFWTLWVRICSDSSYDFYNDFMLHSGEGFLTIVGGKGAQKGGFGRPFLIHFGPNVEKRQTHSRCSGSAIFNVSRHQIDWGPNGHFFPAPVPRWLWGGPLAIFLALLGFRGEPKGDQSGSHNGPIFGIIWKPT